MRTAPDMSDQQCYTMVPSWPMSENSDDWAVTSRLLTFDPPRSGGPSRPDYMQSFDREEARGRIGALAGYVENYVAERSKTHELRFAEDSQDNGFTLERSSGETLLVRCYGNDIFDLIRFPAVSEIDFGKGAFHEMALDLDTDVMITLVRRFVEHGNFEDENA